MVDKQKKTLETSLTSKLIPRNDASSTQSQAKCPEASKHHESSSQESRPEGFGKKIFIKLRMQTTFSLPQDLDKLIKIEKGMLPFNGHLLDFLYGPIKVLKWEIFFMVR